MNTEGSAESIQYTVEDNASDDVTSDCTITLDSPLEGLTVSNGGITFTVGASTEAGEYRRTMTASYTVDEDTFTDTAIIEVTVTDP